MHTPDLSHLRALVFGSPIEGVPNHEMGYEVCVQEEAANANKQSNMTVIYIVFNGSREASYIITEIVKRLDLNISIERSDRMGSHLNFDDHGLRSTMVSIRTIKGMQLVGAYMRVD
jgi:hypothetical protein